jgi:hypothetical protein
MSERNTGQGIPTPYQIEFLGDGIETLAQLVTTQAAERQQPVVAFYKDIPVVSLPGDDPEAVAQRWTAADALLEPYQI